MEDQLCPRPQSHPGHWVISLPFHSWGNLGLEKLLTLPKAAVACPPPAHRPPERLCGGQQGEGSSCPRYCKVKTSQDSSHPCGSHQRHDIQNVHPDPGSQSRNDTLVSALSLCSHAVCQVAPDGLGRDRSPLTADGGPECRGKAPLAS